MTMNVGNLRKELKGVSDDTALYILYEGAVTPVDSMAITKKGALAIIHGKGKPRKHPKRFTNAEDGLIGGLNGMGETDAMIAELLGRTESSITKRKKLIGLS